jgi:GTP-binding protein
LPPPIRPRARGGGIRILYAAQTSVAPPTFVFFTNVATSFHLFRHERFLVNQLREAFGFASHSHPGALRRRKAAEHGQKP